MDLTPRVPFCFRYALLRILMSRNSQRFQHLAGGSWRMNSEVQHGNTKRTLGAKGPSQTQSNKSHRCARFSQSEVFLPENVATDRTAFLSYFPMYKVRHNYFALNPAANELFVLFICRLCTNCSGHAGRAKNLDRKHERLEPNWAIDTRDRGTDRY